MADDALPRSAVGIGAVREGDGLAGVCVVCGAAGAAAREVVPWEEARHGAGGMLVLAELLVGPGCWVRLGVEVSVAWCCVL